jgi:hypothetical protein
MTPYCAISPKTIVRNIPLLLIRQDVTAVYSLLRRLWNRHTACFLEK